jgi:hypothetical protein
MVLFARHCDVCHATDRDKLYACPGCFMVNFCCKAHEAQAAKTHGPDCERFRFLLECMRTRRVGVARSVDGALVKLHVAFRQTFSQPAYLSPL